MGARPALALLLDHGARIDGADPVGGTATLTAASANRWARVEFLLERGASIWPSMRRGATLATYAAGSRVLPNHPEGPRCRA